MLPAPIWMTWTIWTTALPFAMKLSGIGAKDGRVRRLVLVEIEGMSTLTGDGDVAPSTLTNAIRATMAGTSSSSNLINCTFTVLTISTDAPASIKNCACASSDLSKRMQTKNKAVLP